MKQGSFQGVLVLQVGALTESPNLHITAGNDAPGLPAEKQNGGAFQFAVCQEVQMVHQLFIGDVQVFPGHPAVFDGFSPENVDAVLVQVVHADAVHRYRVPAIPGFGYEKFCQRRTAELLFGAAAPIVILALIADRVRAGVDLDLDNMILRQIY